MKNSESNNHIIICYNRYSRTPAMNYMSILEHHNTLLLALFYRKHSILTAYARAVTKELFVCKNRFQSRMFLIMNLLNNVHVSLCPLSFKPCVIFF